ncbi:hypothetical protein Tco_0175953, partial [Tanacetum coccineum]
LTPQLHESAGDLPRLKLPLHSCSLSGSTSANESFKSVAEMLPDREHECNERDMASELENSLQAINQKVAQFRDMMTKWRRLELERDSMHEEL